MKSLIWKEWRENLKWALLAMVALGAAEMYALYHTQYPGQLDIYHTSGITICKKEFLMVTTFGSAAVGLLLGLLQILPELRKDQWAALLHRPVSRGVIFAGKVLAGLLLYALATVPPFLLSVWLAASPGHFATPFVPDMVLPGAADIGTGCVYYFAAIAMALQRDKWAGLKAFPVLAALHLSYFVTSNDLFYVVVEAAILMALALLVAGWATMLHQEKLHARPWAGKAAFLAVVFYGACGMGDVAKSIFEAVGPAVHSRNSEYYVSDKGVPLRVTTEDNVTVSVTDLDGKPFSDSQYQPGQVRSHLLYMNSFSSYIGDSHGWHPWRFQPRYRDSRDFIWSLNAYDHPRFEQWFFLVNERSFVCYLVAENKAVAKLDARGFQPALAEPMPLPPECDWSEIGDHLIFPGGKSASFVSLPLRTSTEPPLPEPGPIFGVSTAYCQKGNESMAVFGMALSRGMAVYDRKGALLTTLPYHQDMDRWGQLEMGFIGAGNLAEHFYLIYQPSEWIDKNTRSSMPSYLEEMDVHGQVLHTWTLPPLPPYHQSRNWKDFIAKRIQSPAFFFGNMGYQKIGAILGSKRLGNDLARQLGQDRRQTREISLYVACLSVALAGITFLWARRVHFSQSRAWAWTAFVLLFNIAGFIAFRLASDWPRLVACPGCRSKRPIHENECPECGTGWPAPPAEGTEIMEHNARAVPAGAGV